MTQFVMEQAIMMLKVKVFEVCDGAAESGLLVVRARLPYLEWIRAGLCIDFK